MSAAVRFRLYLTWGHPSGPFTDAVREYQRPLQELLHSREPKSSVLTRLLCKLDGRITVAEQWMRYPGAPVDPAYYNDLLAKVGFHGSEEKAARTLSRASFTNRGVAAIGSAVPGSVQIEIEKSDLAETTTLDA